MFQRVKDMADRKAQAAIDSFLKESFAPKLQELLQHALKTSSETIANEEKYKQFVATPLWAMIPFVGLFSPPEIWFKVLLLIRDTLVKIEGETVMLNPAVPNQIEAIKQIMAQQQTALITAIKQCIK